MKFRGTWRCRGADEECEGKQPVGCSRAADCVHLGSQEQQDMFGNAVRGTTGGVTGRQQKEARRSSDMVETWLV